MSWKKGWIFSGLGFPRKSFFYFRLNRNSDEIHIVEIQAFRFSVISISMFLCPYRYAFRRNFDVEIGISISMSKSEFWFRFRFRHRNSDSNFGIGISIQTSEFRIRYNISIQMSKFFNEISKKSVLIAYRNFDFDCLNPNQNSDYFR
jgi:hypothetical protein